MKRDNPTERHPIERPYEAPAYTLAGTSSGLDWLHLLFGHRDEGGRFTARSALVAKGGLLGTGQNADRFAHLFGFAAGGALGAAAGPLARHPPRRTILQPLLARWRRSLR